MSRNKGCIECKKKFNDTSEQLNYQNFKKYKFKSETEFKKHISRNKKCPAKLIINTENINWIPYIPQLDSIDENDYYADQEITQLKHIKHTKEDKGGKDLWFDTTKEAVFNLTELILNQEIQWISLVAQPGSGKTAVVHYLIYHITLNLPNYEESIPQSHITITTGMSDIEWYDQIIDNFKLRDDEFLWNTIKDKDTNFCITHRSNFHKRIKYLLNNQKLLSNHLFIIDESHFADDLDLTIDNELQKLGLTEKKMIDYNIKVILISATPDVTLSIMTRKDNHKQVRLLEGNNYNGFKYFYDKDMIKDYDNKFNIENEIKKTYTSPRYHFIRARTNQEKGEYRTKLQKICSEHNWNSIEDDSDHNIYLSFKNDDNEKTQLENEKTIIQLYNEPNTHTIILIKNKYQASKRLKLTKYTGLITEKSSQIINTTVTCNGLIPRFFGYYSNINYKNNELPLFVCSLKSVKEYINFTDIPDNEPWIYNGKDYTSQRLKSNEYKTMELRGTIYSQLGNEQNININCNIKMEGPYTIEKLKDRFKVVFNREYKSKLKFIKGYILNSRLLRFLDNNITSVSDLNEKHRLYNKKYQEKSKLKSPAFGISTTGKGQKYMIYPVYIDETTPPNDVIYYFHYLIINNNNENNI
jgi:hypothetical protein